MHQENNLIRHNLARISAYEMNPLAQNLLQDKTEEWGLTAEQVKQLGTAAPEELELLGQTIRKVWKWPQFAVQTEHIEELVSRKQLLTRGLDLMDSNDLGRKEKDQELKTVTQQLQQLLIIERDQEDAVDNVVSEIHKWTRTAAKKNALYKLLSASSTYTEYKDAETLSKELFQQVMQELQSYAVIHDAIISDNGQTFDTGELLDLISQ